MVGGQTMDMESEGKTDIDLPTVQFIHTHKTGALIKASVKCGAILGNASERDLSALVRYGESVGLAFQIADDILDIEGDSALLGKNSGNDAARGKATYPAVIGLAEARSHATVLLEIALEAVAHFDEKADPLRALARYIVERKS
jgi:geranylgeranyl diphosphate synthase type II